MPGWGPLVDNPTRGLCRGAGAPIGLSQSFSFEVQDALGEGKSAVGGAEHPLEGSSRARAPSSVWSRLVDRNGRRGADDNPRITQGGGGGGGGGRGGGGKGGRGKGEGAEGG